MKRRQPRRSGAAPAILLLLPWVLVGSDLTGRAAEATFDQPGRIHASSKPIAEAAGRAGRVDPAATPGAASAGGAAAGDAVRRDPVSSDEPGPHSGDAADPVEDTRIQPSGGAAPKVEVRVGEHDDFKRVVFEWPEPIDFDVVQHAQQVVIAFARPGRIDLSRLQEGFGERLLEARAEGGDATRQVVLRLSPDTRIRSFSLKNDRVVALDLLAERAVRTVAPAPQPQQPGTASAFRHDAARSGSEMDARANVDRARLQPSGDSEGVEVRVGDHGDFERVVFEWPEPIDHEAVQRADHVTVAFSRSGRIDLSGIQDQLGRRLLEARAEGGDATRQVILRVSPDANIRSFRLKNDRVVVLDVFGGPAPRTLAAPAVPPDPRPTRTVVQERRVRAEPAGTTTSALRHGGDAPAQHTRDTAPTVEVRVGQHGPFERVVFEWPEAISHDVVQRADHVSIAFSRPGRIDLSKVRDRFGERVVEALAADGEVTRRIELRVSPEARIRSFSLENDRVVVVDVFGRSPAQHLARPAPGPEQDPVRELRRALEERDVVIDSLLARVEQLERGAVLPAGDLDRVTAGATGSAALLGSPRLPPPNAQVADVAQRPSPATSSSAAPASPPVPSEQEATSEGQAAAATNAAKPGEFEVVEEEIDRALERTLVQAGALLLPMGQAEIEPYFSYTRSETSVPAVAFANGGVPVGAEISVRRNEFVSGQNLRFGMPFDSQVEFDLPYQYVEQSTVGTSLGERSETDGSGHGMGDLSIGVAKTLVRENGHWWPDLIGRITWDTATGETTSNDVALGGAFNELRGSLSAVKRQDPLAFVGGLSYETTFENDNVKPGDALGLTIGTILAASPGTSLRLALDQRFIEDTKIDGEGMNGSDSVVGIATLGASVVLGRGVLLDVAADIGLTDDAPDYAARASLPIRFNLPVY